MHHYENYGGSHTFSVPSVEKILKSLPRMKYPG